MVIAVMMADLNRCSILLHEALCPLHGQTGNIYRRHDLHVWTGMQPSDVLHMYSGSPAPSEARVAGA
jgi:hypothetical protein